MQIRSIIVAVALAIVGLSCARNETPPVTAETATKAFCYDLLLATGAAGGAPGDVALGEPVVDAADFRKDAELFRAAGESETAERVNDLADELDASGGDQQLSIYLTQDATDAEVAEVRKAIGSWAGVSSIDYVSRKEALRELSREFADQPGVTSGLPKNSLPESFRVGFSSAEELDAAVASAGDLEAVEEVRPPLSPVAGAVYERLAEFQELCRFGS